MLQFLAVKIKITNVIVQLKWVIIVKTLIGK